MLNIKVTSLNEQIRAVYQIEQFQKDSIKKIFVWMKIKYDSSIKNELTIRNKFLKDSNSFLPSITPSRFL